MRITRYARLVAAVGAVTLAITLSAAAESVGGIWDATVTVNGAPIPFRLEISGNGSDVHSYFFNGDEKVNPSTSGSFKDGSLVLNFDSYATKLRASLKDGILIGVYEAGPGSSYTFQARRHDSVQQPAADSKAPNIGGLWEIQVKSPKGESAWHFVVDQSGSKISAAILRVDGDTGTLSGNYKDGKFILSHFTGERPFYLEVTPMQDGSLRLEISSYRKMEGLTALRPADARAKGLAPPDDPIEHTRLKNPNEPLRFSFPDVNGKMVSSTDPVLKGKVVLVNITGSWCPNCHDEAPFLQELYRKYHSQGLEIVALDFEPQEQLKDLSRLRAFIHRYGIEYTYLVAGEPGQLGEKLPQAENLNAWPTTFFVGRDGLVRTVHTGFTSRASGGLDTQLKDEITREVAQLLSENVRVAERGTVHE
jgi:thiol-disulfide isomerase/thioredoxin